MDEQIITNEALTSATEAESFTWSAVFKNDLLADEAKRMLYQAELVKQLLAYCACNNGADIQIKVTTRDGQQATANLFDHAALVTSLIDALDYFQSEMM